MASTKRGRKKCWSYTAGQRGRSWVRAFRHSRDGTIYLEWWNAEQVTDSATGEVAVIKRRRRMKLQEDDQSTRRAVSKAEELAERLADLPDQPDDVPVTLARLIEDYQRERTPRKSEGTQKHDRRAARLWSAHFNSLGDVARRMERHPSTLDRIDWDGFIGRRRGGTIPGFRRVGERQIEYDLKYLIAVLNWGTGAQPQGSAQPYLPNGNPWSGERRRSQRWGMPQNKTPHRPAMTEELRVELVKHAPSWQFGLALRLERDTCRRNASIRRLDWSDIDQQKWTIKWRGEFDKNGKQRETPLLTEEAKDALRSAPSRGIAGPVFPSDSDPSQPTPRDTFQVWLRRAKAGILRSVAESERAGWKERLRGVGYHAEKRAGVRDPVFRSLPPSIQEELAGTRHETLRRVYDEVTTDEIRVAWEAERARQAGAR